MFVHVGGHFLAFATTITSGRASKMMTTRTAIVIVGCLKMYEIA